MSYSLTPAGNRAERGQHSPGRPGGFRSRTEHPSGEGAADYVLHDERQRPIGVVEVKRAASDPQQGLTQGQMYAAGLERDGVRPIIFATNGYEI